MTKKNDSFDLTSAFLKIGCGFFVFIFCFYVVAIPTFLGILLYVYRDRDCKTKRITKPKHFERLTTKNKCPDCNLGDADLRGLDLAEANLKRAKLVEAKLDSVDLQGADLSYAQLSWHEGYHGHHIGAYPKCEVEIAASLEKANLRNAHLYKANLEEVNLQNADLSNANLKFTNLSFSNLQYSNLRKANLTSAYLYRANLQKSDLRNADLANAELRDTFLESAKYNDRTIFPVNFDPKKERMIFVP